MKQRGRINRKTSFDLPKAQDSRGNVEITAPLALSSESTEIGTLNWKEKVERVFLVLQYLDGLRHRHYG